MPLYVVGAGPGDPKLLTLRAAELLAKADVVAFGDLVPEDIAKLYSPQARVVRIGHKRAEHDAAIAELIREAKAGKTVVVLKNGDPTIFGRGIQICRDAEKEGVQCEVVPGVSAFTAAAAMHKIELTDGRTLRHVALLAYPHVSREVLLSVAADTLVVYMMGDHLAHLSEMLLDVCREGTPEVYLCYSISVGGTCIKLTPSDLPKYSGLRPATVIVRGCNRPTAPQPESTS